MATQVIEIFDNWDIIVNDDGTHQSVDAPYLIVDATDEDAALSALLSGSPKTYGVLNRKEATIEQRINLSLFRGIVRYEGLSLDAGGADKPVPSYSFDTTGGTSHITHSIKTIASYPSNAPNFKQAINWDEATVHGTDIVVPMQNEIETHYVRPSVVSSRYKANIAQLTGRYNSNYFRGHPAGEVLFLGATGNRRGTKSRDLWEITFKFRISPNERNIKIGSLTIPQKLGWDYLWVFTITKIDKKADPKVLTSIPKYAYVEKVLKSVNFGRIGIPS